jgi:hypothetical protein
MERGAKVSGARFYFLTGLARCSSGHGGVGVAELIGGGP